MKQMDSDKGRSHSYASPCHPLTLSPCHPYLVVALLALLFLVQCQTPEPITPTPAPTPTYTLTPEIGIALATRTVPTIAVIQVTPTPLPTPTPTPTATPIIYVIEAGDTLLELAILNNTTVEEIETFNPGIQPRLLQIGQQVILPPPATPVYSGTGPTPIPVQVVVSNISVIETALENVWVLGEVSNQGEYPVENVQVEVGLFDGAGQGLGQVSAWVVAGVIPAGEKAPFGVLVEGVVGTVAYPVASVVSGRTTLDLGTRYLDLVVSEVETAFAEGRVVLEGNVANVGESAAADITLITTLYDAQGNVIGYHQTLLPTPLSAGEHSSFTLEITPPGGSPVHYAILAQGIRATP